MPFTALVQRQFALRTVPQTQDAFAIVNTRGIAMSSGRKRRSDYTKGVATGGHESGHPLAVDRNHAPAWVRHLDAFRHRSFCSAATATSVLSSSKRLTSQQLPHKSITKLATGPAIIQVRQCKTSAQYIKDIEELVRGNKVFKEQMLSIRPNFFEESAKGQKPPYMLIECSDSRVAEQAIFNTVPGTMFTSGSIANQFHEWDLNSNSVLSYAVETLEVRHVIVMGHYGCGGVAASMFPLSMPLEHPAHIAVQTWIQPIREIYQNSTRPEIVAHRNKHRPIKMTEPPHLHDPAFRALVEENVKENVNRIARSYVMRDHYASLMLPPSTPVPEHQEGLSDPVSLARTHVFVHGWVYDLENGDVTDLNVTVGPPGREIPKSPWPRAEDKEKEKREEWERKAKENKQKALLMEDGTEVTERTASL